MSVAGPDGRFELTILRTSIEPQHGYPESPSPRAILAATAPGFGPDWVGDRSREDEPNPITLRLRRDDVPIEGRVVSLEGRPVSGASVKAGYMVEFPPSVLAKIRENGGRMTVEQRVRMSNTFLPGKDGPLAPVRTGPDGRFRLTGVGRDRLINVFIEGGSVEWTPVMIFTSSDPAYRPILLPNADRGRPQIEGPRFERTVAPGRVVEGTVRDRDTGQPVPGARVHNGRGQVVSTDAQGRFRFDGQPTNGRVHLTVTVEGRPYVEGHTSLDAGAWAAARRMPTSRSSVASGSRDG